MTSYKQEWFQKTYETNLEIERLKPKQISDKLGIKCGTVQSIVKSDILYCETIIYSCYNKTTSSNFINMVVGFAATYSQLPTTNQNGNNKTEKKNNKSKQKWTGAQIAFLIFAILYLIFWLIMVISAFTCTARRGTPERLFSIFESVFLPEVWLFQHGINASQENVGFFSPLPQIPFQK